MQALSRETQNPLPAQTLLLQRAFHAHCAENNVIPWASEPSMGYLRRICRIIKEVQKIGGSKYRYIVATSVRVPVMIVGHSMSLAIGCKRLYRHGQK